MAASGRIACGETTGPKLFVEEVHLLGGRGARLGALAVAVEHRQRDASPTSWARG